jgi:hypothetical protein
MIPLPAAPLQVAEGVSFVFPTDACCNCGRTDGLSVTTQDTRLTRYMLGGGSEYTFKLPLPFCGACQRTARRRPAPLFHKALALALAFGVALLALTATAIGTGSVWLTEHALLLSLFVAVVAMGAWYVTRRPLAGQTSFYQPVRIARLKQAFMSGRVTGIKFAFTNHAYAQRFTSANTASVGARLVEVKLI